MPPYPLGFVYITSFISEMTPEVITWLFLTKLYTPKLDYWVPKKRLLALSDVSSGTFITGCRTKDIEQLLLPLFSFCIVNSCIQRYTFYIVNSCIQRYTFFIVNSRIQRYTFFIVNSCIQRYTFFIVYSRLYMQRYRTLQFIVPQFIIPVTLLSLFSFPLFAAIPLNVTTTQAEW